MGNRQKYYRAYLFQDLFGDWIVERTWGSKISRRAGGETGLLFFLSGWNMQVKQYREEKNKA